MIDVTEAESLPLDARLIEAGLGRLWQTAAEGTPGGIVHTSSLTLLVVLLEEATAAREQTVLAEVGPAHPGRVILLAIGHYEPRARLGASCRPRRAGRPPACWEEVRLEGSQAVLDRILSAAGLLVLPNLPAHVWWPGDTELEGQLFQRLVEIGDRIIVDSAQFHDPAAMLARYAERAEDEHGRVGFVDLGWRRLEPWRLLVAQLFDDPSDRLFLNDVQAVVVGYDQPQEGPPSGFAAALLIVGWLASRLGWTPEEVPRGLECKGELTFDDGGREVRVKLDPRPRRGGLASLISLEVSASHDGQLARYTVVRSGEEAISTAELNGDRQEVRAPLTIANQAELLQPELAGFGRDRIYEEALQMVRRIARRAVPERAAQ